MRKSPWDSFTPAWYVAVLAVVLGLAFTPDSVRADSVTVTLSGPANASVGEVVAYTGDASAPVDRVGRIDIGIYLGSPPLTSPPIGGQRFFLSPSHNASATFDFVFPAAGSYTVLAFSCDEPSDCSYSNPLLVDVSASVATPEQSSVALLLAGIGILLVMRKRMCRGLPQAS
jgi:hypothetical protein